MAILQILIAGDCLFPKWLISKIYIFDIILITCMIIIYVYVYIRIDYSWWCIPLILIRSPPIGAPCPGHPGRSSGLMYMFQKRRCASKGRSSNPSLSSCLAEKKTGWATAEGRNGLGAMCHVSKGSERHLGKRWKMHENATQRPQSIKQKRTRALSDDPMYNWRIFEYRMSDDLIYFTNT